MKRLWIRFVCWLVGHDEQPCTLDNYFDTPVEAIHCWRCGKTWDANGDTYTVGDPEWVPEDAA